MDIRLAIRKVIHYALLLIIFISPYLIINIFIANKIVNLSYLILVILSLLPIHRALQPITDRLFAGELQYMSELEALSRRILEIIRIEELTTVINSTVQKNMGLANARFTEITADDKSILATQLRSLQTELNIEDFKALEEKTRSATDTALIAEMEKQEIELALPVLLNDELVAALYLGTKRNNEMFSNEDVELLRKLCREAGLVIGNARLVTQRLSSQREMDRLAMGAVIGDFSHELRNNLGANTYAVHLLQKLEAVTNTTIDEKLFDKIKAQLGKFNETSQKALQIVDIMHSYIQIEKPIQKALNLPAILTAVRDQFMFTNLHLETRIPPALPELRGDAEKLKIAFYLLVKNRAEAIRAQGLTPQITITAQSTDDQIQLQFQDNGHPLSAEEQKELFNHYSKNSVETVLVYKIASRHQGEVLVQTLERGNVITFTMETAQG